MNAQKLFYNEERANQGIRRDVRDVEGELQRIKNKKKSLMDKMQNNVKPKSSAVVSMNKSSIQRNASKRARENIFKEANLLDNDDEVTTEVFNDLPQQKKTKSSKKSTGSKSFLTNRDQPNQEPPQSYSNDTVLNLTAQESGLQ